MEFKIRTNLDYSFLDRLVLHHPVDARSGFLQPTKQVPSLDHAHLCYGPRCSTLGTNALGNIVIRTLASMVCWWASGRCFRRSSSMALVGNP